ncbi:MAG: FtsX-like permease family protein, partial [Candidatus Goldbacteria bacterium]|nr:FtsX-like permease family protein [Candidatus Goldiibacteriota bacterium]
YIEGMKREMSDDALLNIGHIVLYNKDYYENLDFMPLEFNIDYNDKIAEIIKKTPNVVSVRPEINFGAIASSNKENLDAFVKAIDLKEVKNYDKKIKTIIKGRFIEKDKEFIIGYKAAELLKVDIGDNLILFTVDKFGSMNAIEGKIVGIYKSFITSEDKAGVVCSLPTAQKLLGMEGKVTEILINVKDFMGYDYHTLGKIDDLRKKLEKAKTDTEKNKIQKILSEKYPLKGAEKTAKELEEKLPKYITASPWQKDQGYLIMILNIADIWIYVILGIIFFVAAMGISNSFLINITGRMQEFGVLRAMGLSTKQLFGMIVSESFLLGLIGSIIGIIPGILIVYYFQIHPIDYSAMSDALDIYKGMDVIMGTYFTLKDTIYTFITGILISVFASFYPAFIAVRKKPVEVLRMVV